MTRKAFVGGNWKCNGTVESVNQLVSALNDAGELPSNVEVVVAPTAIHVDLVKRNIRNDISVSMQNCGKDKGYGARTGEMSADMILDFGLKWTLTGHSERRVGFGEGGESSNLVAEKTKTALDAGLSVIACIGESFDERQSGNTLKVILDSHMSALKDKLSSVDWTRVVIAYEPVWAIGTGLTATPEQAQSVHASIREWVSKEVSQSVADNLRIIYGGSVKASNAKDLGSLPDVDGFLVGGASLKPEFIDIIKAMA
eukprot:195832_1